MARFRVRRLGVNVLITDWRRRNNASARVEVDDLHAAPGLRIRVGQLPVERGRLLAMRHTIQLQGQREAPVGQLSRSCRGEKNGEVEVTVLGPKPLG